MVVLGNEVLFNGLDELPATLACGETSRTAAGTTEIGGLGNAGASAVPHLAGSTLSELVALGNEVLSFEGFDGTQTSLACGRPTGKRQVRRRSAVSAMLASAVLHLSGLTLPTWWPWATSCCSAAPIVPATWACGRPMGWQQVRREIGGLSNAGVSGALSSRFDPTDMVAFGNEVLFQGRDSSGRFGLWATDGTAAGTTEIGGLGNAGVNGASSSFGTPSLPRWWPSATRCCSMA